MLAEGFWNDLILMSSYFESKGILKSHQSLPDLMLAFRSNDAPGLR